MKDYIKDIKDYIPLNKQEEKDKEIILKLYEKYGDKLLTRECEEAHFSSSSIVIDDEQKSVLFAFHNIYKSWAWLGGHVDGDSDFLNVAIKEAKEELDYLETVLESVLRAESPADIAEIKDELGSQGYIPKVNNKKSKFNKKTAPMEFISSDGYKILVGKNNHQNDMLTIKTAFSTDIWLHTKNIPGSHTIIRTEGKSEVPDQTILEAARIAAYYSKGRDGAQVPVDYTVVKNVKKPSGAKPGFVIYDNYNTVYVTPDEEELKKLKGQA